MVRVIDFILREYEYKGREMGGGFIGAYCCNGRALIKLYLGKSVAKLVELRESIINVGQGHSRFSAVRGRLRN
jgi:hypothetical protein